MTRPGALLALITCLFLTAPLAASDEAIDELIFGVIATESTSNLRKGFDPFLARLEARLGVPVKAVFAPDYAGVIEAMRFGKVHLAWFGNKSAMEAVDRAGGEVFAQTTKDDGALGYRSVLIVPTSSPYQSVDEIVSEGAKLVFGNGDPNSTSGYLIPGYYLWGPRGIDPKSHFKLVRNANHEANCLAVATGQVDVATNNTESMERFQLTRPDLAARIRVIWTSPEIPSDPLVWRRDLPRPWKARIKAAILGFGRVGPEADAERQILAGLSDGWGPFLDADNDNLVPIRELDLAKQRQAIEHRDRLTPEERQQQLQAVDDELQRLRRYVELGQYWNTTKE
jgi:phosphonate transport system substrate-binding protein